MSRSSSVSALLTLLLLSLIWGYNWVVMKQTLHYVGPLSFAALRSVLGAAMLFALLVLLRKPLVPENVPGLLLLGLLQTTGFMGLIPLALVTGGAGKTAVLAYTMPLWVLMLAWPILGERIHGIRWLAVAVTLGGLACILRPWRYHAHLLSALLAVSAGFIWAASAVWAKRMRVGRHMDLLSTTAWQMLLGSIPLGGLAIALDSHPIVWAPYFVGALAYNAVLATALAWLMWLFILHRLKAGVAGMGMLLVPLIGVTSAWLQLGERPTGWERAGMVLIFLGLIMLTIAGMRGRDAPDAPE